MKNLQKHIQNCGKKTANEILDLIGSRVKVVRGTPKTIGWPTKTEYFDHVKWIAGNVPVGSTGTIVEVPNNNVIVQIVWDHDQLPKSGYVFGVVNFGQTLELIED